MKRILTGLAWSTDYGADPAAATWTTITYGKLFGENASLFGEEPQYAELIGGGQRVAATDGSGSYPIEYVAPDAEVDGLAAALDAGTPVWVRETYAGGGTLIAGGDTGCYGGVSVPSTGRGSFLMRLFRVTVPGASTGDTHVVAAAA